MGEPFRVGYCRCSIDEQDVEIQTGQLLALGVPADRIFIDSGFSGTTRKNRAGLDNALTAVTSAAAAGGARQVVLTTTKFDRFARNMAEAGQILDDLRERDVLFGLGSSVYDWNDPFGKLFLQTLAMVAEFEANLNHLRTREGMATARAKGRLKGKRPKLPLTARRTIHRRYHDADDTASLPTSPGNTASAAPPSTASSAALHHESEIPRPASGFPGSTRTMPEKRNPPQLPNPTILHQRHDIAAGQAISVVFFAETTGTPRR
ncbi:recombinase family protein [Nocardia cyriacigeorgica]|uniref:recombinase family protein n=1 Tax=Nocardia cyriacigeorgica TaxID=135487 RepID=UPI0034DB6C01